MRFVVDASVAVKWLVAEEDADVAEEVATSGHDLHAPRLMASEVANAIWRKARSGEMERRAAGILLADVPDMPVRWGIDELVTADAVSLALALGRPIHDCVDLALAHRIRALMLTADGRSANSVATTEHGSSVLTLADCARTP